MDRPYGSSVCWIAIGDLLPALEHHYRMVEYPEYTLGDLVALVHSNLLEKEWYPGSWSTVQNTAASWVEAAVAQVPSNDFYVRQQAQSDIENLTRLLEILYPHYYHLLSSIGLYDENGLLHHRGARLYEQGDIYLVRDPIKPGGSYRGMQTTL